MGQNEVSRATYDGWSYDWRTNSDVTPELRTLARIVGYKSLPPTIAQFVEDPFYLGGTFGDGRLYPSWKKVLEDIFPSRIHLAYNVVSFAAALGSGKSTVTQIIALYTHCRLDHLESQRFLRDVEGKNLVFSFNHISTQKAISDFLAPIGGFRTSSSYFNRNLLSNPPITYQVAGERTFRNPIGGDIIFYAFSEINFINYHKAFYAINSAIGRMNSRFIHAKNFFGLIVLDSSPSDTGLSIVNDLVAQYPGIYQVEMSIWKAKAHTGNYFRGGRYFLVYPGDLHRDAFILSEGTTEEDLPVDADRSLVIKVPEELRVEFQMNINRALRDQAGVTVLRSGNIFIKDAERAKECFILPHLNKDVLVVDFYDQEDRLIDDLLESVRTIPKHKLVYIRFDIGVVHDKTGVSIGYFDDYEYPYESNKELKEPTYIVHTVTSISRKSGQETSITKLKDLVLAINELVEVGGVSCDQFQSRQLLQDLDILGYNTKYISVDRNNLAYYYFKNLIYSKQVKLPSSELLKDEILSLQVNDGKVDHPTSKSKDIADAVVGMIYHIYQDLGISDLISNRYSMKRAKDLVVEMSNSTRRNNKRDIEMNIMKNIF